MKSTRNLALASILFALTFTVAPHTAAAMGISTEVRVARPALRIASPKIVDRPSSKIKIMFVNRFNPESLRMILATVLRLLA
jgi:hypothetical protein